VLENAAAYPALSPPSTLADLIGQDHSGDNAYQQLANTVILVSLPIAGCTLTASIAAGLADRKRPSSLLQLTGARLATLRRVVALESGVPLLAVAVAAIGAGFGAAAECASVAQHHPMVVPGVAHYLIRGRDPGRPRHHRGHLLAAGPDHRTRSRQKRMTRNERPLTIADGQPAIGHEPEPEHRLSRAAGAIGFPRLRARSERAMVTGRCRGSPPRRSRGNAPGCSCDCR
jgi:hypothetical protein